MDGDADQEGEPTGTSNKVETLVIVSIESEDLGSSDTPRVYLGGTRMCAGNANGLGNRADGLSCELDGLRGLADGLGAQPDAPSVLNDAEMVCVSHGKGAGTYLGTGDVKRSVTETDGAGIHADASSGRGDVLSIETNALTTANEMQIVSIPRIKEKLPDIPMETTRGHPDEPDGCGNPADTSSVQTDAHSIGEEMETAANETENVRKCQKEVRIQNSPETIENGMPEHTDRWRWVGIGDASVYVPWNAPLEALGTTN